MRTTVAPGMTPPCASLTTPETVPVVICAAACGAYIKKRANTTRHSTATLRLSANTVIAASLGFCTEKSGTDAMRLNVSRDIRRTHGLLRHRSHVALGAKQRGEQQQHQRAARGGNQPDAIPLMRERSAGNTGAVGVDHQSRQPRSDQHAHTKRDEGNEALRGRAQVTRRLRVHVDLSRDEKE